MSYRQFKDENGKRYGSFETFHRSPACDEHGGWEKAANGSCHECAMLSGWYWRAGFPGCLPDGEPSGPFRTEGEAILDAQEQ